MAINLKNPEVEKALQALAAETGESLTEAAGTAFRERLERLRVEKAAHRSRSLRALLDLVEEARATAVVVDPRPMKAITDELWGED